MAFMRVLLSTFFFGYTFAYINDWDERAFFQCPNGQYLSSISSIHSNRAEDRRWNFGCTGSGANYQCSWSAYMNEFDEMLAYVCPKDSVIIGIDSYHDNGPEDRRFRFRCCAISEKVVDNCKVTPFANAWDRDLTFEVQPGNVLKGAFSDHSNKREDRRWKFLVCNLRTEVPCV